MEVTIHTVILTATLVAFGAEEALTDLLQIDLIDDELTRQTSETSALQSNFSATPLPTGSNLTN